MTDLNCIWTDGECPICSDRIKGQRHLTVDEEITVVDWLKQTRKEQLKRFREANK